MGRAPWTARRSATGRLRPIGRGRRVPGGKGTASLLAAGLAACAPAPDDVAPADTDVAVDARGTPPTLTWSVEMAIDADGRLARDGERAAAMLRANLRDPAGAVDEPLCSVTFGVAPDAWAWVGGDGPEAVQAYLSGTGQRFGFTTDADQLLETTCEPTTLDEPWSSRPERAALRPWASPDGTTDVFVGLGGPLDPGIAAVMEQAPDTFAGGLLRLPEPVALRDGGSATTDLALLARRYLLDVHGEPIVGEDGRAWLHDTTLWADDHPAPGLVVVDSVVGWDPR